MSRVRSKDTKPELEVRSLIHARGYRFRLHRGDLPGRPDIVFPSRRKVVFVHGCFWHRHGKRCPLTRLPKSRLDFWLPKLEENHRRDVRNRRLLRSAGWEILIVWECELKNENRVADKIVKFLERNQ